MKPSGENFSKLRQKEIRTSFKFRPCIVVLVLQSEGDVTQDDSQRRFLAQHSVATLLRHCFEFLQHYSNIATLCSP